MSTRDRSHERQAEPDASVGTPASLVDPAETLEHALTLIERYPPASRAARLAPADAVRPA